jgi:hypothetical protein
VPAASHVPSDHLFIGGEVDPATHDRIADADVHYESANLTTHGVIVGMTGSGKTGLGVILLEEALLQGVPTLVIDPKGDMGNLCLSFPDLAAVDFEPWIDAVGAQRDGSPVGAEAEGAAELWRNGLAGWGIGPERIKALRDRADFTIYTPGSASGIPLNIIGSMRSPGDVDAETMADEIEGFASSILGLVGLDADPLSSREHILISNLVAHAWNNGKDIDLGGLIGQIQQPPIRKLGVIELDTFFPPADRLKLAMKLNGLAASPAFASWVQGVDLDIQSMLYTPEGKPRCAIVSIAHLADEERQFVVTLLLSKMVTWMRSQPGTTDLRAMVYMDEVFGFVPPTAAPPAKKPILTILKQARAFGVGMVLSTQNPVDLDYKAISNAGTWMVGRLQTERDKARLLEGMTSASGAVDISSIDSTISGLGKREFLLHSTKAAEPTVFGTRWAMSYLPGPLTRKQISTLMDPRRDELVGTDGDAAAVADAGSDVIAGAAGAVAGPASGTDLADDETSTMPSVADVARVRYLDIAAPWAGDIGAAVESMRLRPGLAARVKLLYDETKANLRHEVEWEAVLFPIDGEQADMDLAVPADHDERDFRAEPHGDPRYVLGEAKIHTKTFFSNAERDLKDRLYRGETLTLFHNPGLKAYSRADETRDEFANRCQGLADNAADADLDKVRIAFAKKIDRVREAMAKAQDRVREAESKADNNRSDELLSGVGDVLGSLLGGRKSGRSILGGLRRAGSKRKSRQAANERVTSLQNRLAEEADELEDLEEDVEEAVEDIVDDWEERAENIVEIQVGLEKNDISVDDLTLVWIPSAD